MDSLIDRFSLSPKAFVNNLRTFREGHGQFVKPTFPWGLEDVNSSRDQHRACLNTRLPLPSPVCQPPIP
jgi:hypothetical protein